MTTFYLDGKHFIGFWDEYQANVFFEEKVKELENTGRRLKMYRDRPNGRLTFIKSNA
jgi:hypothetical protein